MKKRNAFILFFIVLLICGIATIGFMYYLDKFGVRGFLDVATWVAVAVMVIGALSMMGGASSDRINIGNQSQLTAADREALYGADRKRSAGGLAFGLVLFASAILWGAIAYLVYHFFGS